MDIHRKLKDKYNSISQKNSEKSSNESGLSPRVVSHSVAELQSLSSSYSNKNANQNCKNNIGLLFEKMNFKVNIDLKGGELVYAGKPECGVVRHFKQLHYFPNSSEKTKQKILKSQHEILDTLLAMETKHIFLEGLYYELGNLPKDSDLCDHMMSQFQWQISNELDSMDRKYCFLEEEYEALDILPFSEENENKKTRLKAKMCRVDGVRQKEHEFYNNIYDAVEKNNNCIKLLFHDYVKGAGINDIQSRLLIGLGAGYIYYKLTDGVEVHRTTTLDCQTKIRDFFSQNENHLNLSNLTGEAHQIILKERESYAINKLKDFLKKNPNEEAVLIYGGGHDFGQYGGKDGFDSTILEHDFGCKELFEAGAAAKSDKTSAKLIDGS